MVFILECVHDGILRSFCSFGKFFVPLPWARFLIGANPGLKFCSTFCIKFYLHMHCLEEHFMLSLQYLRVKAQQYFLSLSHMFLEEKTVLKI